MKKYTVETYYTCTFKTVHSLDDLNDRELSKIDERTDGEVEVIDVKLNNRKTKKIGEKTNDKSRDVKVDNSLTNDLAAKLTKNNKSQKVDNNITSKEEYDHIGIPLKESGGADVIEHPNAKVSLLGTPVEHIIELISKAKHPTRLHYIKNVSFAEEFNVAITRHPAVYRDLMDRYDVRMLQLNNQGAKKNG